MRTIAVYGTLKRDHYNHDFLQNEQYRGSDKVKGTLYVSEGNGLPYLMKGKDKIDVEVYEVSHDVYLAVKGMEEGAGYKTQETKLQSGRIADVWWYTQKYSDFKKVNKF